MIKRIFNWTAGSFFRTLGRFLFYIVIGILVSFIIAWFNKVNAATGAMYVGTDTRQLNVPIVATFYTGSSSGFSEGVTSGFSKDYGYFATTDTITLDGYGEMICFDNPSAFSTNTIYSITLYIGKESSGYGFKTNVKNEKVSIGSSLGTAVSNWNNGWYYTELHYSNYRGTMFEVYGTEQDVIGYTSYLTFIFTSTGTGTAFCAPFNSAGSTYTGTTMFFGYHYDILGSAEGLSSEDIENAIADSGLATASSVSQIQTSVNSLQTEIASMQEEQEKTNDKLDETNDLLGSESDDTTDKSCGVICKLKGIFTGIIELPGKIVSGLIDALKSLFVPTEEQLQEIIDKSSGLAENFGFVGETIDFFIDIFTSMLGMVNGNGCITLPRFEIGATSLFNSHVFWEEQRTCLSDNVVLNTHIDTIRTITSITLVCLFLGFASKQFFKILSKSESESESQ